MEGHRMATSKKGNKTLHARLNKRIPPIFKSKTKREVL